MCLSVRSATSLALSFVLVAASSAAVVDFENVVTSSYESFGSSLTYANVGGSGVNVTFTAGVELRVYDLVTFGGYPGPGRNGLIDLDWNSVQNPAGTDIRFSKPVGGFSLLAGDFGSDDDGPLRIEAFNAAGTSLGVATAPWSAAAMPPFALLSLNVSGISRVHYSSGGQYTGSTFIDNVTFNPVPEPSAFAALGLGAAAMLRRRKRV